jgi:hypothetical protein
VVHGYCTQKRDKYTLSRKIIKIQGLPKLKKHHLRNTVTDKPQPHKTSGKVKYRATYSCWAIIYSTHRYMYIKIERKLI